MVRDLRLLANCAWHSPLHLYPFMIWFCAKESVMIWQLWMDGLSRSRILFLALPGCASISPRWVCPPVAAVILDLEAWDITDSRIPPTAQQYLHTWASKMATYKGISDLKSLHRHFERITLIAPIT